MNEDRQLRRACVVAFSACLRLAFWVCLYWLSGKGGGKKNYLRLAWEVAIPLEKVQLLLNNLHSIGYQQGVSINKTRAVIRVL